MQPYPTIKNTTVSNTDVLCLCVGGRGVFIIHLRPMFLYNEFIRNIPFNNMHSVYYVTITVLTFQVNIFIQFTNLLCVSRFFSGTCLAVFVFDGTLQPPQIHTDFTYLEGIYRIVIFHQILMLVYATAKISWSYYGMALSSLPSSVCRQ